MGARRSASESHGTTYTLNVTTDSTQVPDWLLLCNKLSFPSRVLAGVILYHQKQGDSPTVVALAADLKVDTRTIARWLDELRAAKIIDSKRNGRSNFYSFLKPRKRRIHDPTISDPTISDPTIMYFQGRSSASDSLKTTKRARTNARAAHGGGGGHDSFEDSDPPPTTTPRARRRILPSDITTDTGRWMVREGFNIVTAHKLQHLPLAACQADFARRLQLGQRHGAIGQAWEVEAPAAPPIVQVEQSIDDLGELPGPPPGARSIEEAQALFDRRRTARGM